MTTPQILVAAPTQVVVEITSVNPTVVELTAPSTPSILEINVPGPQGPPGSNFATYTHYQSIPSTVWLINHNLGYRPAVDLLDVGSQCIDGEISHPSVNQTVVILNPATAGIARLI